MDHINLQEHPIDVSAVQDLVDTDESGSTCFFVSKVRKQQFGRVINGMIFTPVEDTEPCDEFMKKLCGTTREKFPDIQKIALVHRLGKIKANEPVHAVAVSSMHHADACNAVHFIVQMLKAASPFEKKTLSA